MLDKTIYKQILNASFNAPIDVEFWDGEKVSYGDGEPIAKIIMHEVIPVKDIMSHASLTFGEAYMDGKIEIQGDLQKLVTTVYNSKDSFLNSSKFAKLVPKHSHTEKKSKADVQSHYDIGNDFYRLWLDETMSYSCGYFLHEDDTLYQAQVNKVDYILKKLYLKEGMSLLDVGCGWGFLLIEAAKKYGIHGMGITLSQEQYREFQSRIAREHLEELLTVELMDYRDLPRCGRRFDRIVSVGMVEHVGRDNYQLFMDCAKEVLNPGGLFLLHFISALKEHPDDPWIKKYIFPGGVVPSLREMLSCAAEDGFHTMDVENLRLHYNRTLLCWEKNFKEHISEVREMFDERFIRMWDLYLSACAATFHNGLIDLHQVLFTKGIANGLPTVRWY